MRKITEKRTEEKTDSSKVPIDVGVDKQWLEAILNRDVKKPTAWTETDVREMVASKAQSRIQGIVQSIYWDLLKTQQVMKFAEDGEIIDQPDEDYFDGWYERNDLQDYNQKYKLMQMLNTIARALHVTEPDGYAKEDFDDILKRFVNRILEEPEYLEVAANVINEKYPGLASPFKSAPSVEELNEREAQEYAIELGKVEKSIESNIDQHASVLQKISRAKRTDFEKIALDLDRIVIFGPRNWELILYNLMSPHAPRLLINNLDYRANIHGLLAGDISTAKSKILKISKLIAPKMLVVDSTTVATLEGHAPTRAGGEIDEGVLDYAKNGVIIVEEYTNAMAKIPLMRRVMDGEHIEIWKKGSSKGIDPNSTMLAACNPEADFFREEVEGNFRQQIAFKEGILSRFDVLILLTATQVKNELLIDKMNLMSTRSPLDKIDFAAIKEDLEILADGMMSGSITRVTITSAQEGKLKEAFLNQNTRDKKQRLLRNRPLVILRDLENLARLVNVIATVNFSKRTIKNGLLKAKDDDIDKAIQLWENLISLRVEIYGRSNRNFMTVKDEILVFTMRAQAHYQNEDKEAMVPISEVKAEIVDKRRLIGKTTFYKELQTLRETGEIVQQGKRDGKIAVVIK